MDIGPVELAVFAFPVEHVDAAVVTAVTEVVAAGYVTVLDLVSVTHTVDDQKIVIDFDEAIDRTGLDQLPVSGATVLSDEDVDLVWGFLEPGTSAAVIVYEETWARNVADAVRRAGGEVALHLQLSRQTVEAAIAAAADPR